MGILSPCTISFATGPHQGKANCYRVTNDVVPPQAQDRQWKKKKKGQPKKCHSQHFTGKTGQSRLAFFLSFHQMSVLGSFCSGLLQMGLIFGALTGSNIRKRGAIPRLFSEGGKEIFRIYQRIHPMKAMASNERIRHETNSRSACRGRSWHRQDLWPSETSPKAKSQRDPSKLTGHLMPPEENDLLFPRF